MGGGRHARDRPLRDRPDRLRAARRPPPLRRRRRADGADAPPRQRRAAAARRASARTSRPASSPGSTRCSRRTRRPAPPPPPHAWDWLEGEVADELGPRWRRAAALPEPGETWGYVSVVTTAAPDVPAAPRRRLRRTATPHRADAGSHSAEPRRRRRTRPAAPSRRCRDGRRTPPPGLAAPARSLSSPSWPRPWSSRGAAGLSLLSGEEPPAAAAPAPKGPSLAERVRHDLDPALRANRRVTAELT